MCKEKKKKKGSCVVPLLFRSSSALELMMDDDFGGFSYQLQFADLLPTVKSCINYSEIIISSPA